MFNGGVSGGANSTVDSTGLANDNNKIDTIRLEDTSKQTLLNNNEEESG